MVRPFISKLLHSGCFRIKLAKMQPVNFQPPVGKIGYIFSVCIVPNGPACLGGSHVRSLPANLLNAWDRGVPCGHESVNYSAATRAASRLW